MERDVLYRVRIWGEQMLNDSKWEKFRENDYILKNNEDIEIAEIYKTNTDIYELMFIIPGLTDFDDEFVTNRHITLDECRTSEIAMWKAGNIIANKCNEWIKHISKVRDHLPSPHEMFEKAYPDEDKKDEE